MPYASFLRPRREVLSPEGVDGIIDLANLISAKKRALEKDPERFFALTVPEITPFVGGPASALLGGNRVRKCKGSNDHQQQ